MTREMMNNIKRAKEQAKLLVRYANPKSKSKPTEQQILEILHRHIPYCGTVRHTIERFTVSRFSRNKIVRSAYFVVELDNGEKYEISAYENLKGRTPEEREADKTANYPSGLFTILHSKIEEPTTEPEQKEEETEMKNTRTAEKITEEIIAYFDEHEDVYNAATEELDAYNGYLGDDRYYSMDELDELYNRTEPTEILYRAFYGHDEDVWTLNKYGEKEYGPFNPNREYFTYNGYGNLVSSNYKDYSSHLDHYIIESMFENRECIDAIVNNSELSELFDELENAKSESKEA